MSPVPHRNLKAALSLLLLAFFFVIAYNSYSKKNPLEGFEPSAIQDERQLKIQSLQELLKLDAEDFKTHAELAALHFELKELPAAEKHALAAISIGERKGATKEFLVAQYLLLSKIYEAMGQNEKALQFASRAADLDTKQTAPLKRKGRVYESLKKNDKARLEYLKALKLDEKDPETYALLANQEFKKGKPKAAMEWLRMGVRRNPTNAVAFRNLARGYVRTKQYDKALKAYERSLELDPKNAETRYEYAKLLQRLGEKERYRAELQKAYEADPKNPKILRELARLERGAGRDARALELLRDALKRDGKNTSLKAEYEALYNHLAAAQKKNDTPPQAATAAKPSVETNKGSDEAVAANATSTQQTSTSGKNVPEASSSLENTSHASAAKDTGIEKELAAGKKAFAEKDYSGAERAFRDALQKDPNSLDARFFLARTLDQQDKKEAAMAEYRKVLAKDANHSKANYHLGRLLYQDQKYREAERAFEKSAKADTKFAAARYSQGLALEKQGKEKEALAAYEKASEVAPNLTQAHFNSAILLKKQKRYDEALRALSKSGNGADVSYQEGEIYLKQKKYAQAKEALSQALSKKPQHYEAAFNLALVYHKIGDAQGADKVLSRVIRDDSPADLHYTYGKLLEESGELAAAEKQYRESVKKNPRYFNGWLNLGRVSAREKKYDQAENAYRQALTLEGSSFEANYNLANVFYNQKKHAQAIEYFENARAKENSRDVVLPLSASYEATNQFDKAAKTYQSFLDKHPKDQTVLEHLGYLYYRKIKNSTKAKEQFQKLLQYYPHSAKKDQYAGMIKLIEQKKNED